MASWLIFAAWTKDDDDLWNSHWIAQETARLAPSPPRFIERDEAVRQTLEAALTRGQVSPMTSREAIEGIAFFGHGKPDAVLGSDDKPALDLGNVHLLERRWAHAFACNTGRELVPAAMGADLFVGYDVRLTVDWTLEDIPEELRKRMATLVAATTLGLLEGIRSKTELQERARIAQNAVAEWLSEHPDEGLFMIGVLAQQLVQRMITSR